MSNAIAAAEAALEAWSQRNKVRPTDPGMQSMRFHETARTREKALNSYLNGLGRAAKERQRLVDDLDQAKREARIAALPTTPVSAAELATATWVLERVNNVTRWHQVKRVNAKTVTCHAPYPGFDEPRIPHSRIVGVKTEGETR